MKNHWVKNIITRGNMNISAITRGFILPSFKFVIRRRRGGSPADVIGEGPHQLRHELEELRKRNEEVDAIDVYVEWNKDVEKHGKKIYVKLIEKKITADLLKYTNEKYKINVELVKD